MMYLSVARLLYNGEPDHLPVVEDWLCSGRLGRLLVAWGGPTGSSRVVFGVVEGMADLTFAADTATRFPSNWAGALGVSTPPLVHGVADMLGRPHTPWTWQKRWHRKKNRHSESGGSGRMRGGSGRMRGGSGRMRGGCEED